MPGAPRMEGAPDGPVRAAMEGGGPVPRWE